MTFDAPDPDLAALAVLDDLEPALGPDRRRRDRSAEVRLQGRLDFERAEPGRRPSLPTDEDLRRFLRDEGLGLDGKGTVVHVGDGYVGTIPKRDLAQWFRRWVRTRGGGGEVRREWSTYASR